MEGESYLGWPLHRLFLLLLLVVDNFSCRGWQERTCCESPAWIGKLLRQCRPPCAAACACAACDRRATRCARCVGFVDGDVAGGRYPVSCGAAAVAAAAPTSQRRRADGGGCASAPPHRRRRTAVGDGAHRYRSIHNRLQQKLQRSQQK